MGDGTERAATKSSGYVLGLVPITVALVFGALLFPRAAPPEDVPVPYVDARALGRVEAVDGALAADVARTPLPGDVRALGSAIRAFNELEADQVTRVEATPARMNEAREAIDRLLVPLLQSKADDALVALRAAQLEAFVKEAHAFAKSGVESPEMQALGGPFVRRMREVGWCHDHTLMVDDDALRTMFKLAWNTLVRVDRPPFTLALDEERALYAFYLRHPHAPEGVRKRIDEARAVAHTDKQCAALVVGEQLAAEQWRVDKVKRLAAIDPTYPRDYALGVARFRHKDFEAAAQAFRDWLGDHPDGPYTLRARNHLRASLAEIGLE